MALVTCEHVQAFLAHKHGKYVARDEDVFCVLGLSSLDGVEFWKAAEEFFNCKLEPTRDSWTPLDIAHMINKDKTQS